MTNYEKALKLEEEYLALRTKPEEKNTFKLHKKLENLGFTLESFQEEKCNRFFEGKNIEIKITSEFDVLEDVQNAIINNQETILIGYGTQPVVFVPKDETSYSSKYCEDNNIFVVKMGHSGGVIVTSDEDTNIGLVLKKSNLLDSWILKKLNSFFHSKNLNSYVDGNDIMIENYKIVGVSKKQLIGDWVLHCVQISQKIDINLINNICIKPMNKLPGQLCDFGNINRNDILEEVRTWLL